MYPQHQPVRNAHQIKVDLLKPPHHRRPWTLTASATLKLAGISATFCFFLPSIALRLFPTINKLQIIFPNLHPQFSNFSSSLAFFIPSVVVDLKQ
ncbi:hypothetical protein L1987_81024 [Smallanthus sonchifolius]|uniref:Uncharacterized protein n=1 Tax=Smallanthus sonchifolius TaxID=185202 RepID=A0ACB8YNK5_9ASTR|nr:hypothetical protein L1987_81024 [Smallanthus sonchifolius]